MELRAEFGIAAGQELLQSQGAMSTRTLNCYSCGAAVTSDAPNCDHCGARLASISCPSCFGMMFQGAKFCPHCGSPAVQWQSETTNWQCPSCRVPMLRGTLRDILRKRDHPANIALEPGDMIYQPAKRDKKGDLLSKISGLTGIATIFSLF